jgi:hypothetical protein
VSICSQSALTVHSPVPSTRLTSAIRGTYSAAHVARLQRAGHHVLCSVPWGDFKPLFHQHRERLFWSNASFLSVEQKRRRQANSSLPKERYELAVLRHQLTDPDTGDHIRCRVIFGFSSADQKVCQTERRRAVAKIRVLLTAVALLVSAGGLDHTLRLTLAGLASLAAVFMAWRSA